LKSQPAPRHIRVVQTRGILPQRRAAEERMELYYAAHPGSPAAVRRPRLMKRGKMWVALLGPSVRDGIVGLGPNVEAALRAFDAQYLNMLHPPIAA
jgi:hypothetical protein